MTYCNIKVAGKCNLQCIEYIFLIRLIIYVLWSFTSSFSTFYIGLLFTRTGECLSTWNTERMNDNWTFWINSLCSATLMPLSSLIITLPIWHPYFRIAHCESLKHITLAILIYKLGPTLFNHLGTSQSLSFLIHRYYKLELHTRIRLGQTN